MPLLDKAGDLKPQAQFLDRYPFGKEDTFESELDTKSHSVSVTVSVCGWLFACLLACLGGWLAGWLAGWLVVLIGLVG